MIDGKPTLSDPRPVFLLQPPEPPPANNITYRFENQTFISVTSTTTTTTTTVSPPSSSTAAPVPFTCPWTCELTNDAGYVVYSALGSFYIPMFVMLFFYWRIYRAAVRTTRAINQGFKTTKGESFEGVLKVALSDAFNGGFCMQRFRKFAHLTINSRETRESNFCTRMLLLPTPTHEY